MVNGFSKSGGGALEMSGRGDTPDDPKDGAGGPRAAKPTDVQRRYLESGLGQPGGKLPAVRRQRASLLGQDRGGLHRQWLGRALVRQPAEAGLAGLQADACRLCRRRGKGTGRQIIRLSGTTVYVKRSLRANAVAGERRLKLRSTHLSKDFLKLMHSERLNRLFAFFCDASVELGDRSGRPAR